MPSQDSPNLPLVSVIIPAYNADRFLKRTLASVCAQTYGKLEIIVVNDGSTDSTAAIVDEAALVDERIRIFHQTNMGVAAARNRGLREARGDFIAPIDADDVWDPCNVALQMEALQRSGANVAVCYAWFVTIDQNDAFCGASPMTQLRSRRDILLAQLNGNFIGNSSSTVMRRAAVERVGGYDPTLRARGAEGCEDQGLYALLSENWDFTFVPKYLIAYRKHPWSMSSDADRMARSQTLLLADLRDRWPSMPAYRYGHGIAEIYEGRLMTAFRCGEWRQATEVVRTCARLSWWSVFDLVAKRAPIRTLGFVRRRLTGRPIRPEPQPIPGPVFWSRPRTEEIPRALRADDTDSFAGDHGLI